MNAEPFRMDKQTHTQSHSHTLTIYTKKIRVTCIGVHYKRMSDTALMNFNARGNDLLEHMNRSISLSLKQTKKIRFKLKGIFNASYSKRSGVQSLL